MGTIRVYLEADATRVACPAHGPTARHGAGHIRGFDQQDALGSATASLRVATSSGRVRAD
jgi:transposase